MYDYVVEERIVVRIQVNKSSAPSAAKFCLRDVQLGKIGFLVEPLDQHIIAAGQHWVAQVEQDGRGYFKASLLHETDKPDRAKSFSKNKQAMQATK